MNYESIMSILETGDLILFKGKSMVGKCIECISRSKYCHIGMVLKDPTYIDPKLKGYYLWEASRESFPDAENNEIFYGVQITLLEKVLEEYGNGNVFYRKLISSRGIDNKILYEIHKKIHHHKYDLNILDWIRAGIYSIDGKVNDKSKLVNNKIKVPDKVWCSSLIGFIFINMGLISSEIEWKYLSPKVGVIHMIKVKISKLLFIRRYFTF